MRLPLSLPPFRNLVRLVAAGLVLAALPLGGERPWTAPLAWAGDDDAERDDDEEEDEDDDRDDDDGDNREDDDGNDDGEDRDDEDDDRAEDDDRDDDDGDVGGPAGRDDAAPEPDREDAGSRRPRGAEDGRSGAERRLRNITVLYPDGWTERIVDGRYELLDQQSRLVVRRDATVQDFRRMIALR